MSVPTLVRPSRLAAVDFKLARLRVVSTARYRHAAAQLPEALPEKLRRKPITRTAVYLAPCPRCGYTCIWSAVHYKDDTSAAVDMCPCPTPPRTRRWWLR